MASGTRHGSRSRAEPINIPYFPKENRADNGCAPVCLRMALAFYGITPAMPEIYRMARSLDGKTHYTLPWGMCLGAVEAGLRTIFISKNCDDLLPSSYDSVADATKMGKGDVQRVVSGLLRDSKRSRRKIRLVDWRAEHEELPAEIVGSGRGVVIPTLWWDTMPHNVVLTEVTPTEVRYHDPNDGPEQRMARDEFRRRWLHRDTDNDLVIVSRKPIRLSRTTGR